MSYALRRARSEDLDALYDLLRERSVYLYLADDREPSREFVSQWLDAGIATFETIGVGMWLLEETGTGALAGLVLFEATEEPSRIELSYVLHADHRGRGLATAMSVAAIRHAFDMKGFREVVAGADLPNRASFAVMERLGMKKWREMTNPKYPGIEYRLTFHDPLPTPSVDLAIDAEPA